MMRGFSLSVFALATVLFRAPVSSAGQDVPEPNSASLAFSKDGHLLREVQSFVPPSYVPSKHIRAVTYDAATGSVIHELNLEPGTSFSSATPDGRSAIIYLGADREDAVPCLLLVDTESGKIQNIPSTWFDADDRGPYAQISADGRLISAFTQSGQQDGPLVVSVYRWRTKKLVAKQSDGYPAGGITWGGVTVDGKIEFVNNRAGGKIVDPRTGRQIVPIAPLSVRSPDGAWNIDFPNAMYDDPSPAIVVTNGRTGQTAGKLDLRITADMASWGWQGAFCGTSGKFIAATDNSVQAFEIPSGKKIADFATDTWQDTNSGKTSPAGTVACSFDGKRVAIRSGARLTLHNLQ